jgi:hypothetical protein
MDPSQDSRLSTSGTAADATGGDPLLRYCRLAADGIGLFADNIETMATRMREGEAAHLSTPMTGMADGLRRLSGGLRSQGAEQILRDAQRLAREHPALLIAGGIAAGLGLAQLTRASVAEAAALGDRLRSEMAEPAGRNCRTDADTADAPPAPMTPGAGESRD